MLRFEVCRLNLMNIFFTYKNEKALQFHPPKVNSLPKKVHDTRYFINYYTALEKDYELCLYAHYSFMIPFP